MPRGVPTAAVVSEVAGRHERAAREPVDEVDLPTPDEPRRTNVRAGRSSARTLLDPLTGDVAHREHRNSDRHVLRLASLSRSSQTSSLVRTTTGSAPLSQAATR